MARGDYHKTWGLSGDPQECETASTPRHAWFRARCLEAGLDPKEAQVASYKLIERHAYPRIRRLMNLKAGEAEAAYEKALPLLRKLPDFFDPADQFERDIIPVAGNKPDFDERPDGVRGVSPDRASQRFQGAPMVGRGDLRLTQDLDSAARLFVQRGGMVAQPG